VRAVWCALPMLPAPLQFIIAMFAYAVNERMARKVEYLREDVLVLKEALAAATGKTRIDLSAAQRRRLAVAANIATGIASKVQRVFTAPPCSRAV
jgi:hypothetical protein